MGPETCGRNNPTKISTCENIVNQCVTCVEFRAVGRTGLEIGGKIEIEERMEVDRSDLIYN